jgi:hypothetical protein
MKRLLLFAMGAMVSMASFAQEEDVTHYIQNAGFDVDLTWQVDGASKEIVDKSTTLSNRSLAGVAADGSLYAVVNPGTPNKRSDGRTFEATNGFIGAISGWETTMPTNKGCEWVYFGTLPYALGETAVPVADDGNTYLTVPSKPELYSGDDNVGMLYMRAGWSGQRSYKQVVKLPCAVYRLEYWTININPNSTATAEDLTKITCRKDVFKDDTGTGLSSHEWTKHEFEFIPTSEFTIEFGFKSANAGSGANPIVCLDGIKLYKIDEADPIKLLESDIQDISSECAELAGTAGAAGYNGLSAWIVDYGYTVEELMDLEKQEDMEAGLKQANEYMVILRNAVAEMENVDAILAKMEDLLRSTNYPGKAAFEEAYQRIMAYRDSEGAEGIDVAAQILGVAEEATDAMKAYFITQEASAEQPADFSIFIKNPWFISAKAEPVNEDGMWVFPNALNEDGTDNYTEGSAESPDLTSDGWYIAGADGGDQRLNWQRGRSCWNAWNNNFYNTLAVAQDITGLPNGYYTVSCDLITQGGCLNDQHVFAKSIAQKKTSDPLTTEGWDYNEWETVAMNADQKVLVVDGKLTIGAEGTGTGSGATGWFLATNFHLYYLGAAPEEAVKAALNEKVLAANELAAAMHFKADQKALNDSIAKFANNADYVEALTGLSAAMDNAEKSQAKWEEYVPEDGTVEGKTLPTVQMTLKKNGGDGYGAAEDIVQYAYDYVMGWAAGDTASYVYFDDTVELLKNYLNTYTPAYNNAAEIAAAATSTGKASLEAVMNEQKAALLSEMKDKVTVDAFVEELNGIAALTEKQNIYDNPNATDYTAFIQNPNLEAETGWVFDKGNGNTNTTSGQWFDGGSTRYIDSYNSGGLQGYIAQQLITGLPNGTYTVGVYTRTPAEGAYVFTAPAEEKTWVEIPLNYYQTYTETGEDTTVVASDKYGPMWEEAKVAIESGSYTELQDQIYNANGSNGRGWQHQEMAGIVVNNHELLIGTAAGSEALGTPKVFAGAWYSVGGWTLTLTAKGDNTGWDGPIASGIKVANAAVEAVDGIYTLSGVRTNQLQRGLNIVVSGGKARKVLK